jgi:CDGSH-type Zn-finger protein
MDTLPQKDTYMLCRCGKSKNKPYCDAAHVAAGFDGTETASKESYEQGAEHIHGAGITLHDKVELCVGAEFCDRLGGIWSLTQITEENCGISDPVEAAEYVQKAQTIAIEQACNCPSGRLVMHKIADARELIIEPDYEQPSIALIEDPTFGVSCAIWVRGNIPIFDGQGAPYEVRNRITLCRCGASNNKAYCDGRHYSINFDSGSAALGQERK